MPLVHALPVATTTPGTPRTYGPFAYNGTAPSPLIHVQPLCPTWTTTPATTGLHVQVQQSFNGGATWEDFANLDIVGGQTNRAGQVPFMGCQVTDTLGARQAQLVLTVTGAPLDCGVDLTT